MSSISWFVSYDRVIAGSFDENVDGADCFAASAIDRELRLLWGSAFGDCHNPEEISCAIDGGFLRHVESITREIEDAAGIGLRLCRHDQLVAGEGRCWGLDGTRRS